MAISDTTAVQQQYIDFVKQSQSMVLDAVRATSKLVQPLVKDLPEIPFADQLPSVDEAVKGAFDFVEQVVASQREFAAELVAAFNAEQN